MNNIDYDYSLSELSKVIKIIEGEFAELSSILLIKELKSIPQFDMKNIKAFAIKSIQAFENAKNSSIGKITKYFNDKRQSKTDLKVKWITLARGNHCNPNIKCNINPTTNANINIDNYSTNNTSSIASKNFCLRISPNKYKSTTPTQKRIDKSLLLNIRDITPKHTHNQNNDTLILNNNTNITNVNSNKESVLDMATIIKSKSTKRIFSNSSSRNNILIKTNQTTLAQLIVEFIEEMKQLQSNIMKKANNVNEMKKTFEKKKVLLYQEALKLCNLSPQTHDSTIISNQMPNNINLLSVNKPEEAEDQKKNVMVLNESISLLRIAIEDIKSNSQFITEQLRTEINGLNDKLSRLQERNDASDQIMSNHIKSIKDLYLSLTMAKQSKSFTSQEGISSGVSAGMRQNQTHTQDFEWYIAEIEKEIKNEGFNHEGDITKMQKLMKSTSKDIIDIIKPYIKDEDDENEIDFECFDSKSNYEEEIISAIENLKKYIKNIISILIANKKEKESLLQSLNEAKVKSDTYKAALDQTVIKITQNDNGKANITERDNIKKLNNDLLNIQNDLLKKLEQKDIEAEKNQETIRTLIQLNTTVYNNGNNLLDKYRYVLQLYSNEQDKVRQLKSDYLHLIQEFSCYVDNGKKITIDLASLANNIPTVNEKEKTYESYLNEEISSEEMGRLNENDLLNNNFTDDVLHVNFTKESKCSNKNQVIHFKKIQLMKSEIIELNSKVKKLEQKLIDNATLIEAIGNTIEKLVAESHLSQKTKELFIFIFRLLNYQEETINSIFMIERDKKKTNK